MEMLSFALDFIQVSRPGWWLVTAWLYIAPCRTDEINVAGLIFVLLPMNAVVYGINDASDLHHDLSNDRKGNFIFGPKGWSRARLNRVLVPAIVMTFLPLMYWGHESNQLLQHMAWFAAALLVNYLYNFYSFSWNLLLVCMGYGSVTLLSYWRHGGSGLGLLQLDRRWYFANCNQEYWMHLALLLVRGQFWTELLDYESDRRTKKWTTLSRLPTKELARRLVLAVLLVEALWCVAMYQIRGSDWAMLLIFATVSVISFVSLEYVLPRTKNAPVVDLTYLAMLQNAGGIHVLYDCWRRGTFVR
jgi:4-hydroxybenzoate polyprenyltransferase